MNVDKNNNPSTTVQQNPNINGSKQEQGRVLWTILVVATSLIIASGAIVAVVSASRYLTPPKDTEVGILAVVAAVTLFAILGQIAVSAMQWQAMREGLVISRRQFESADRPWIMFSVAAVDPLTFNANGTFTVMLRLTARNVGRSPAVRVSINPQIIAIPLMSGWGRVLKEQDMICQHVTTEHLSYVVFPENEYVLPLSFNQPYSPHPGEQLPDGSMIELYLVGCVDYQFSGHERRHQTRFVYTIQRKTADFPNSISVIKVGEDVPADKIYLQKAFIGGDYAD